MSDCPKVSVILPVFNVEKYLYQCLESIVNQTLVDIEIICVNDGSTDSSVEVLKEFAKTDYRITIINQENKGAGAARNKGLELARGEYLSFLDSDDFFENTMLEEMYCHAREKNADITICQSYEYDDRKNTIRLMDYSIKYNLLPQNDPFYYKDFPQHIFNFCVGWAWDKLYKTSFVKETNLLFQNLRTTNDAFFVFSSLMKAEKISILNEKLAYHRKNTTTSLSQTRERSWDCFYQAINAIKLELLSIGVYNEVEQSFINWALHFSLWNLNTIGSCTYVKLYDKLREEYFVEFELDKYTKDYFYNQSEYKQYLKLKTEPSSINKKSNPIIISVGKFFDLCSNEGPLSAMNKVKNKVFGKKGK